MNTQLSEKKLITEEEMLILDGYMSKVLGVGGVSEYTREDNVRYTVKAKCEMEGCPTVVEGVIFLGDNQVVVDTVGTRHLGDHPIVVDPIGTKHLGEYQNDYIIVELSRMDTFQQLKTNVVQNTYGMNKYYFGSKDKQPFHQEELSDILRYPLEEGKRFSPRSDITELTTGRAYCKSFNSMN